MRWLMIPLLTLSLLGCELPQVTVEERSDQFAFAAQTTISHLLVRASALHRGDTLSDEEYLEFLSVAENAVLLVDEIESQMDLLDQGLPVDVGECLDLSLDATSDGKCTREDVTAFLQDLRDRL